MADAHDAQSFFSGSEAAEHLGCQDRSGGEEFVGKRASSFQNTFSDRTWGLRRDLWIPGDPSK